MVPVAPLDDASPAKVAPTVASTARDKGPLDGAREATSRNDATTSTAPSAPEASRVTRPSDAADPLLGKTTLLVRVAPGIAAIDDLNGRKVAVGYPDAARQAAVAATFRSLSLTPDLTTLSPEEAERQFQAGDVKAIVTLADGATAAQAPDTVLKLRLEPYVVRQPHPPPT